MRGRPAPQVVDETDGYTSSVAGVLVDAVRIGRGERPNVVLGIPGEHVTVTRSEVGFPMATHASVPDDRVLAAFISGSHGGSRWCGIPLRPGMVVAYGPGAHHAAINRPGLCFSFASLEIERLVGFAAELDLPVALPPAGGLQVFPMSPATLAFGAALDRYGRLAVAEGLSGERPHGVFASVAGLFGERHRHQGCGRGKGIDSRLIVRTCIELAETTERIPSVGELCIAAHVSERRLREAFTEEFDQPPSQYFRAWALDEAHRRFREAGPGEHTVTQIASTLGFHHLGRFAGQYRQIYGESPSSTLRADPVAV